jgi:hypothetical protein
MVKKLPSVGGFRHEEAAARGHRFSGICYRSGDVS